MRPRIRTATLTGYAALARSLGLDPAETTAAVGLAVADLDAGDRWIPAAPVARLLELSAQRSGVEDFALRLADLRRLGALGPISVALRDEPDLRAALDVLIRYEELYNEALHLRMGEDDVLVTVTAWLELGEPAPTGQALDLVMAVLLGVVRALVREDWEPLSASFARPPPADPGPYLRRFGPWVRFGGAETCLVFHTRELALPVVTSDPSIRPYTQDYLRSVLGPRATTAAAQTAEVLELLLPLGQASTAEVGRRMGLSPRQLQRSLAEEGTSFSGVVHEVRAALAERYLSVDHTSLTDLSLRLGFAAPSAFSRWFRQQFGTSPSEWRRTSRAKAPTVAAVPAPRSGLPGGDRRRPQ
jgi:AraC-like DNA-binding protein